MTDLKFPVFSKYTFLLTGLDKMFKAIDTLDNVTETDADERDLVSFLKYEKDMLEKFILGESSL